MTRGYPGRTGKNAVMSSTMRAAHVTALGPADSIRVGDLPRPSPGPGDVLVAVDTVAVNPVDTYVRSGRYPTPLPMPFVVGRDLVGTVAHAHPASGFRSGEPVWCDSLGHDGRQGSFAEYAVVPAGRLYRVPDGADPLTTVAVAHPAATAYLGWFVHARLRAGETVLVTGAGGNVGTAAVELAAAAGADVLATARPEDHDRCRTSGAQAVWDYRDATWPAQAAAYLRDRGRPGVDVYWDTPGLHDMDTAAPLLSPGARYLVTAARLPSPDAPTPVPWGRLYTRDVSLLGFVISRASVHDLAAAAGRINQLLPAGRLTARIAEVLPLEATADAHRRIEAGGVRGRLLVSVRG